MAFSYSAVPATDDATTALNVAALQSVRQGSEALARWQRAAVAAKNGVARAKVLLQLDSYGQLGAFEPAVNAFLTALNGAPWASGFNGFFANGDFTLSGGAAWASTGWNARTLVMPASSTASLGSSRIFTGASVIYGQGDGTISLWVNGSKVGEASTVSGPGVLDIPAATGFLQATELRSAGGTCNVVGVALHPNGVGTAATSGVLAVRTHFSGGGFKDFTDGGASAVAFAQAFNPDLIVQGFFINAASDTYMDEADAFLAKLRTACPTTSIVLMVMPFIAARPDDYVKRRAVYALAARYGCAVSDVSTAMPALTAASTWSDDGIHLSATGTKVFGEVTAADWGMPFSIGVTGATTQSGVVVGGAAAALQSYVDGHIVDARTGTSESVTTAQLGAARLVTMTNASANTLNLPTGVLVPVGATVKVVQLGAGKTTAACPGGTILTANKACAAVGVVVEWINTAAGWVANGSTIA